MGLLAELATLTQRAGTNVNTLATQAQRAGFSRTVRSDIANVIGQLNTVYKPLAQTLTDGTSGTTDALSLGLGGDSLYSYLSASASSAPAYWDSVNVRKRTVKETFDVLLAEIASLQNQLTVTVTGSSYDDTAILNSVNILGLNLNQLLKDTHGPNYTLTGTGNASLTYSLSQILDAIGANFTGYTATGNTYLSSYPAVSLTIAQSNVTNLVTDLTAIRNFTGMDNGAATTDYSAHGAITTVSDGDSIELAVQKLDVAVAAAGGGGPSAADATAMRVFMGMNDATATTVYTDHGAVTTITDGDSLEEAAQKLDAGLASHASAQVTDLSNIRSFMGMNDATATTVYSDHGTVTHTSDGHSLEQAVQELDAAIVSAASSSTTDLGNIHTFVGMDTSSATTVYTAHGAVTHTSDGHSLEQAVQELDAAIVAGAGSTSTDLTNMRTFMGMNDSTANTVYTDHGTVTSIVDGDSLEVAAQKLDAAIAGHAADLAVVRTFTGMDNSTATTVYSAHGAINITSDGNSLEQAIQELDFFAYDHSTSHERNGIDWIDAAKVACSYISVNYSRVTGPNHPHLDQLGSHLKGIDSKLNAQRSGFQDNYDYIVNAGVGGEIILSASQGAFIVQEDSGSALGSFFQLKKANGTGIFEVVHDRVKLSTDVAIEQVAKTADPPQVAGSGQLYVRADSGDVELAYQDGTHNVFLTRDGRVKELEMGTQTVMAQEFTIYNHSSSGQPSLEYIEGAGNANPVYAARAFHTSEPEYATFWLGVPRDENGFYPGSFHVELYTAALHGTGTGYAFDINASTSASVQTMADGTNLKTHNFIKLDDATVTTVSGVDTLYTLDFGTHSFANNGRLISFQITRNTGHADDDWNDDVGVLGCKVTWYR